MKVYVCCMGTTYEIHELNDKDEPVRLVAAVDVTENMPAHRALARCAMLVSSLQGDDAGSYGVFDRTFKRVA